MAMAHFVTRDFDKAVLWAGRALARRPGHLIALRTLFWIHSLEGRQSEAKSMLTAHPRINVTATIAEARAKSNFERYEDRELVSEALRRLGFPE
jgi:hypothetical protein